jgi:hypothetical protein
MSLINNIPVDSFIEYSTGVPLADKYEKGPEVIVGTKVVQAIKPGEYILQYGENEVNYSKVTSVTKNEGVSVSKIILDLAQELIIASDNNISVGDVLTTNYGISATVVSEESIGTRDCYSIEVEGSSDYTYQGYTITT